MTGSLSTGLFYSVSALYFTRVIGLSATTVGLGLSIAGAVGVAASFLGGYAADRWGADRVQALAHAVQGLALFAFVFATGWLTFTMVACIAVGGSGLQASAKAALQAQWFTGPERVGVRARLRVVTNVFIGLGTCLAGGALVVGTHDAYRLTMALTGLLTAAGTAPLVGLRSRTPGLAQRLAVHVDEAGTRVRGSSPLRDRTYMSSAALNAVIAMQFGLQSVGVPLWVATRTVAPTVVISVLLIINTVFVALFQVRAARGTHEIGLAGRAVRRGSLLLAAACVLFGTADRLAAVAAVAVLLLGGLLASWAEVLCEGGGWGLAFELADPRSAGAYQGLSQSGYALANMLSPLVVTAVAVNRGLPGWALLAAVFAAAGVAVAAVARHAVGARAHQAHQHAG